MQAKPINHKAYLSQLDDDVRESLERLSRTILSIAPGATELISYGMPAFKFEGRMLVSYCAFKNHCSFFPWDSSCIVKFSEELKNFSISKGTIRFTFDKQIPIATIKKIVKYRIKMNRLKSKKKQ
jgi:uncharacterized protein YdhG (YjbR/CyaY superfamily)